MLSELLTPRLPELGKIKIGAKGEEVMSRRGNKFRPPVKLDHFVIVKNLKDETTGDWVRDTLMMNRLIESGCATNGDGNLIEIPVAFLSNEIEDAMQAAYVWYIGRRCGARSTDGKSVTWFCDPESGAVLSAPRTEPFDHAWLDKRTRDGGRMFKMHAALNCVIRTDQSSWGGVYRFRSGSTITAQQLYGSLIHLAKLTGGVLMGLPLVLVLRKMEVAPEGKTTTVYVVHVELRGADMKAIQNQVREQLQMQAANVRENNRLQLEYQRALHMPGYEEGDDLEDVADEFSPETIDVEGGVVADTAPEPQPVNAADLPESVVAPAAPPTTPAPDTHDVPAFVRAVNAQMKAHGYTPVYSTAIQVVALHKIKATNWLKTTVEQRNKFWGALASGFFNDPQKKTNLLAAFDALQKSGAAMPSTTCDEPASQPENIVGNQPDDDLPF